MKAGLSIFFVLGFSNFLVAQFEIMPFMRWDTYPKFTYAINPVNSNEVKINGTSWGINIAYKLSLTKHLYIKPGLGYYRFSFNNIRQVNSQFGTSNSRVIEDYHPPGGITPGLIFSTDKYFYNTISGNIGIEKYVDLKKDIQIICGFAFSNFYAFNQNYHVTYPSPNGDNFKQTNNRYFGFSASINAGIQKKLKKFSFGPSLIIPIFDTWKKDDVFPQEENSKKRNKWFSGVGLGIQLNFP